ncbi:hypothetical protein Pmani_025985 [Petrolisthes manimaculis]|uniref:Uncharacterized protein n=1 Tax=Petrolisthes manimaculis TaxID=1843537 RepID=A0AAE1P6S8_9EUCA|nr:hypothetical protein Pmani_025985 [Petrolisthes manimaculis]
MTRGCRVLRLDSVGSHDEKTPAAAAAAAAAGSFRPLVVRTGVTTFTPAMPPKHAARGLRLTLDLVLRTGRRQQWRAGASVSAAASGWGLDSGG